MSAEGDEVTLTWQWERVMLAMDDDRCGPGSLAWLYQAVPASEELDLVEQYRRDRAEQERLRQWREVGWIDDDVQAEPVQDEPSEPEVGPALTDGQCLGLLRHLLGAESCDEQ